MGSIQRPAFGLLDALSVKGIENLPQDLLRTVQPVIDVLQCYGNRIVVAQGNAALPEGTSETMIIAPSSWWILHDCSITVTKTATMTALRSKIAIRLNNDANQEVTLATSDGGPFGATETGVVTVNYSAPFPRLMPPGTTVVGRIDILGTDATAFAVLGAHVSILG